MTKTILIADDDQDLVAALSARCRQMGLNVFTASDATDAFYAIDIRGPDLVCLDIGMPGGNGLAVCEMLADDDQWRGIPVIILTGRSDEETIQRCRNLSAHYVAKSHDVWQRMKPLICELLDIAPAENKAAHAGLTSGWASTCEKAFVRPMAKYPEAAGSKTR